MQDKTMAILLLPSVLKVTTAIGIALPILLPLVSSAASHRQVYALDTESPSALLDLSNKDGPSNFNIALHKPTAQSSDRENLLGSVVAVDGNKDTIYWGDSCTHTSVDRDDNPWWRVDLEEQKSVGSVLIVNRGDCCGDRLSGFTITVGNNSDIKQNPVCHYQRDAQAEGSSVKYACDSGPIIGEYVGIFKNTRILTLCEVEVFEGNIAFHKPTAQSSDYASPISPNVAVDGKLNSNYWGYSCSHTSENGDPSPWWRVDLESTRAVESVRILNRSDCCSNRLRDFTITVGNNTDVKQNPVCHFRNGEQAQGADVEYACDNGAMNGQYVGISKDNPILTLCEVQVFEKVIATTTTTTTTTTTATATATTTSTTTTTATATPTSTTTTATTANISTAAIANPGSNGLYRELIIGKGTEKLISSVAADNGKVRISAGGADCASATFNIMSGSGDLFSVSLKISAGRVDVVAVSDKEYTNRIATTGKARAAIGFITVEDGKWNVAAQALDRSKWTAPSKFVAGTSNQPANNQQLSIDNKDGDAGCVTNSMQKITT